MPREEARRVLWFHYLGDCAMMRGDLLLGSVAAAGEQAAASVKIPFNGADLALLLRIEVEFFPPAGEVTVKRVRLPARGEEVFEGEAGKKKEPDYQKNLQLLARSEFQRASLFFS